MKQKILALTILVFAFSATYSQSFHFGIKAGANINKLTGEPFSSQFSYGYHVGVYAELGLGKKWGIEPDILFNQVNVDTSDKFSSIYKFNNIGQIQLRYLSIPIVLEYKLNNLISLQVGPQFGILMNQSENLTQNGQDAFKNGDISLVGGVQIKFGGFRFYGRYIEGLNNLNNIGTSDTWKGQTIQFGVGFSIL
jgi:hypothetical protein